jgi:DNA-binding FrmR family transcriptional regulator
MLDKSKLKNRKSHLDSIEIRLNKIEGQIRGVQKMYQKENCDSIEITTQIQAIRAALARVAILVLSDDAKRCAGRGDLKKLETILEKTFRSQ